LEEELFEGSQRQLMHIATLTMKNGSGCLDSSTTVGGVSTGVRRDLNRRKYKDECTGSRRRVCMRQMSIGTISDAMTIAMAMERARHRQKSRSSPDAVTVTERWHGLIKPGTHGGDRCSGIFSRGSSHGGQEVSTVKQPTGGGNPPDSRSHSRRHLDAPELRAIASLESSGTVVSVTAIRRVPDRTGSIAEGHHIFSIDRGAVA